MKVPNFPRPWPKMPLPPKFPVLPNFARFIQTSRPCAEDIEEHVGYIIMQSQSGSCTAKQFPFSYHPVFFFCWSVCSTPTSVWPLIKWMQADWKWNLKIGNRDKSMLKSQIENVIRGNHTLHAFSSCSFPVEISWDYYPRFGLISFAVSQQRQLISTGKTSHWFGLFFVCFFIHMSGLVCFGFFFLSSSSISKHLKKMFLYYCY